MKTDTEQNGYETFLCDREVADLLRVSVSTVRNIVKNGPSIPGGIDLRLACPRLVGKMRRWPRSKVYELMA